MNKLKILCVLLLLSLPLLSLSPIQQVQGQEQRIETTTEFLGQMGAYNGYLWREGVAPYPPNENDTVAWQSTLMCVGQAYVPPWFITTRGFGSFNTSAIPDTDSIFEARLQLYKYQDFSVQDFVVKIYGGFFDTLDVNDWDAGTYYAGGFASIDWQVSQEYTESIPIAVSQINRTGFTQFEFISDRELIGVEPSTNERVWFGGGVGEGTFKLKLTVVYGTTEPIRDVGGEQGEEPISTPVAEPPVSLPEIPAFDWSGISKLGLYGIIGGVGAIAVVGIINRLPKSKRTPTGRVHKADRVPEGYKGRKKHR